MQRLWVKDKTVSSWLFAVLLSISSTELPGTKRTFLHHYKHSCEHLRLPSFQVPAAGSATTAVNICLPLTLPLVLVIFGAKVPESCLSSPVPSHAVHEG